MKHSNKRFLVKRLVLASAILSMAALLGGCGSSNNSTPNNGVGGAAFGSGAWVSPTGQAGCANLTQQIGFQGTGTYTGSNFMAGNVPMVGEQQMFGQGGGQTYGSLGAGAAVGGPYGARGMDGVISLNLTGGTSGQGSISGNIQLSGSTQSYINNMAMSGQLPGITVPGATYGGYYGQPVPGATATGTCVSGLAISGGMRNPAIYGAAAPYAVKVFLYLQNTQVWYQSVFSN